MAHLKVGIKVNLYTKYNIDFNKKKLISLLKYEKDLGLQKSPRHISMNNVHYLLIKRNTLYKILTKFLI